MSLSHIKHQRIQATGEGFTVFNVPVATAAELFLQVSSWHLGGWLIKPSFEITALYRQMMLEKNYPLFKGTHFAKCLENDKLKFKGCRISVINSMNLHLSIGIMHNDWGE